MGDAFYIIMSGTVVCNVEGVGDVATLGPGEFFGEMALLKDAPRTANVIARDSVVTLVLERKPFEAILGPLQAMMDEVVNQRQSEIDQAKEKAGVSVADGAGASEDEAGKSIVPIDSERGGEKVQFDMAGIEVRVVAPPRSVSWRLMVRHAQQLGILGEGSFGIVRMVRYEGEVHWLAAPRIDVLHTHASVPQIYALKRLWKEEVRQARQTKHTKRERRVLQSCNSPFIIKLRGTQQDQNSIFMLLELVQGGEVWTLVYNETCVTSHPLFLCNSDVVVLCASNVQVAVDWRLRRHEGRACSLLRCQRGGCPSVLA